MKFWEHYKEIENLISRTFNKESTFMFVGGTWAGDKKIKGEGVDIYWPQEKWIVITRMHRQLAKMFVKNHISEELKVTVTQTNHQSSDNPCLVIQARKW